MGEGVRNAGGRPGAAAPGGHRVCPWWLGYLMDNPLRRRWEPLEKIFGPYVRPGMRALDVGCGFGFYSLAMARMVGEGGSVLAVDMQPRMLDNAMRRARKAGLGDRIVPHLCPGGRLALPHGTQVDFAVAGHVLHEMPDPAGGLGELRDVVVPGGLLYVAEPRGHVDAAQYEAEVDLALELGFEVADRPEVFRSRCVLLRRGGA